ncbi:hypothetical protein [Burkholderia gladioli]|uniref:hypothetical protein n=1 Tax=Burkholderia gladioli TaxID=28095 RepID=UPI00164120B2|nr:hypothetical protein [Burkholderia gladioli]MBU9320773.1 hypothetical protein [Burkholderia gladioli]
MILRLFHKKMVAMQENPVESGILVVLKLELQCARFQAVMHCRRGFCSVQETDLMQQELAVAPSVTGRVAILRAARERGTATHVGAMVIEVAGRRPDDELGAGRGASNGKQHNGKQNDNEVCLGIEAMHARGLRAARVRSADPEWPVPIAMGMQIADLSERNGSCRASRAAHQASPLRAPGILGGLGIVRNTFFLNRPADAAARADETAGRIDAPMMCVAMPVFGAGVSGGAMRGAGSAAIAPDATRQARHAVDAFASAAGGSAAGQQAGAADIRPTRRAARSCRNASRQDERIAARATHLMSVPRVPFARRPAAGARSGADRRQAAYLGVRMPNDFMEARINVLDVVTM